MYNGKKVLAINYADAPWKKSQKYNTFTAYKVGKVDEVIEYGPEDIDEDFRNQHKEAFVMNNRLIGRWGLWRPHILMDAVNKLADNDYLIYSDSGTYYINKVSFLLDAMEKANVDFMPFELTGLLESTYTKRDVFVEMKADTADIVNSFQRESTVILLKKTEKTLKLLKDYLNYAINSSFIFTDEDNKLGLPNYPDYIDTRHNQSVLSILSKQYGYFAFRDPSQWGGWYTNKPCILDNLRLDAEVRARSIYPTTFMLHRRNAITKENIRQFSKTIFIGKIRAKLRACKIVAKLYKFLFMRRV